MRFQQFAFARQALRAAATQATDSRPKRIQNGPMRNSFSVLLMLSFAGFAVPGGAQTSANPPQAAASAQPSAAAQRENYDPLLDLPPLPNHTVTLLGGTVVRLDEIMNHMVLQPFGSKQKVSVAFDSRTHFYQDGKAIGEKDVKQGQRVYVDSMLNGSKVFAKTIWIRSTMESGIGQGQIMGFDSRHQTLTVRDELSNQPLHMQLTSATIIRKGDQPASASELVDNALVALSFGPQRQLEQITILATPGTIFTFAGPVTYVDMSRHMIAIDNRSDSKKYDIYVTTIADSLLRQIRQGMDVNVSAAFDGNQYDARSLEVSNAARTQP